MNLPFTGNIHRLRRKSVIGQLVLLALGVELLILASFTCLQLPTPTQVNLERYTNYTAQRVLMQLPVRWQTEVLDRLPVLKEAVPPVRTSPYVPLIPAAIFAGYVLGLPLGLMSGLLYLGIGLAGQGIGVLPFAEGGGLEYYRQPGFGYLIGIVAGTWFAARTTMFVNNSFRQVLVIVAGVVLVHLFGLLYLVGGCLGLLIFDGDAAYMRWQPWLFESIRNFSWYSLPYDLLLTLALVGLGFPFRWLTATLTAPDIAMRPKTIWDRKLEQVL
jgi:hypothetical protein